MLPVTDLVYRFLYISSHEITIPLFSRRVKTRYSVSKDHGFQLIKSAKNDKIT